MATESAVYIEVLNHIDQQVTLQSTMMWWCMVIGSTVFVLYIFYTYLKKFL